MSKSCHGGLRLNQTLTRFRSSGASGSTFRAFERHSQHRPTMDGFECAIEKCETLSMSESQWTNVDEYLVKLLLPTDEALGETLSRSAAAQLPPISVAPNQGKLLELLARVQRSNRILEIGTLGGYSTIWLARALPSDGRLVTLELEPMHAEVARKNIDGAGLGEMVEIRVGPAATSLQHLIDDGAEPFDFIFIDADKEGYPQYLDLSLQLSRSGTVIVADNVVRDGEVMNPASPDERVQRVRKFLELAAANDRIEGTAVQTVGSKGYDGFALFVVTR
jgi:predicted O-methyltransferase YrrM